MPDSGKECSQRKAEKRTGDEKRADTDFHSAPSDYRDS